MARLGLIIFGYNSFPGHLMPRPGLEPMSANRVAPTRALQRNHYQLSYRTAAADTKDGGCVESWSKLQKTYELTLLMIDDWLYITM